MKNQQYNNLTASAMQSSVKRKSLDTKDTKDTKDTEENYTKFDKSFRGIGL